MMLLDFLKSRFRRKPAAETAETENGGYSPWRMHNPVAGRMAYVSVSSGRLGRRSVRRPVHFGPVDDTDACSNVTRVEFQSWQLNRPEGEYEAVVDYIHVWVDATSDKLWGEGPMFMEKVIYPSDTLVFFERDISVRYTLPFILFKGTNND